MYVVYSLFTLKNTARCHPWFYYSYTLAHKYSFSNPGYDTTVPEISGDSSVGACVIIRLVDAIRNVR